MAITSIGYDGQVGESQWAKMIPFVGSSTYGVVGPDDWKVSSHPTTDKAVNVSPGSGWGHGVFDSSDSTYTVTCPPLSSGTRWDMIAVKRDWNGTAGATTFTYVVGSGVMQLPAYTSDPGNVDYQPIALVQWTAGQTKPTAIVDLRVWSANGGLLAKDSLAQSYVDELGTVMTVGGDEWRRVTDANGVPTWSRASSFQRIPLLAAGGAHFGTLGPNPMYFYIQGGSEVIPAEVNGYGHIWLPKPFPNGLLTAVVVNGDNNATGRGWEASLGSGPSRNDILYVNLSNGSGTGWKNNWRCNWIAIGW